jgi:hypothetical protein
MKSRDEKQDEEEEEAGKKRKKEKRRAPGDTVGGSGALREARRTVG